MCGQNMFCARENILCPKKIFCARKKYFVPEKIFCDLPPRGRVLQPTHDPPGGALAARLSRTGSRKGIILRRALADEALADKLSRTGSHERARKQTTALPTPRLPRKRVSWLSDQKVPQIPESQRFNLQKQNSVFDLHMPWSCSHEQGEAHHHFLVMS